MHFYQILVDKKLPHPVLTYSSRNLLVRGAVVRVLLREKPVYGVVLEEIQDKEYLAKLDTIKEVLSETGFTVGGRQLRFMHNFERNTFNNLNVICEASLRPYTSLGKRDHEQLVARHVARETESEEESTPPKRDFLISEGTKEWLTNEYRKLPKSEPVEFIIDSNTLLRIMDIIRINIYTYLYGLVVSGSVETTTSEQLFLFPELKYLDRTLRELKASRKYKDFVRELTEHFPNLSLALFAYSGRPTKKSRDVVRTLLDLTADVQKAKSDQPTPIEIRLICATRSGLFLPLASLRQVTLLDEANSMYIQEQNSLYFDTRDLAFVLARTYEVPLTYLSTLPSVRLYSHYPETARTQLLRDNEAKSIASVTITNKDRRHDEHDLLSNELLVALGARTTTTVHTDDENQAIFSD